MITENYYAHIAQDGRKQLLSEHLHQTAALAKQFAQAFGASSQGELTAMAHDLGKYAAPFQNRLLCNGPKVDHATIGALECMKQNQLYAAMAIAGHHSGLLDGGSQADLGRTFLGRLNKARQGTIPAYDRWKEEIQLPQPDSPALSDPAERMFFTRMLYSCLTDADYLDTEAFMDHKPLSTHFPDFDLLWSRLQAYIAPWFPPQSPLNQQRCAVLQNCIEQGQTQSPGLFTLSIPTGGGKTVSSLAFALAQARQHHMQRIIYVIPYTSIIEQTAAVFRRILGKDQVLEHHSHVSFSTKDPLFQAKAAENWDAPVIVTTSVQFFESVFASRPSQCRKLHNLANSVILFDEAQMLPLHCLQPCVFAMAQLVKSYGASVVLCSATQPALAPLFHQYLPDTNVLELSPSCQKDLFQRVTFRKIGIASWKQLATAMQETPQVLCIVNTRKSARTLYALLRGEGCCHLSTLMCPAHRLSILTEIRTRLQIGLPCKVVSTSLLEAGADLDFPAVFREEAGLDSIVQAAGRCNREGKRPAEESIVTIFRSEAPPPPLFRTAIGVGRHILESCEDPSSPEAIHAYFQELLALTGKAAQDTKEIMALMQERFFPFQTLAERFRFLETPAKTIYIPWDSAAESLLTQLQEGRISKSLFRQLGQYGVPVYPRHLERLDNTGALAHLDCGVTLLKDLQYYDEHTGLALFS